MATIDTLIQNFNNFNIPTPFCNLSEINYDDCAVNGQKIKLYFWDTYEPEYRTMDAIYTFIMMKKCRGDKWVTLMREDGKEYSFNADDDDGSYYYTLNIPAIKTEI